ncbi:hypothetical protein FPHOBKDP_00085 [Listeria phage LPJP1]|nr:hypothetical protein FPHOBKDP_00085 [Listeria phage LPJP1]
MKKGIDDYINKYISDDPETQKEIDLIVSKINDFNNNCIELMNDENMICEENIINGTINEVKDILLTLSNTFTSVYMANRVIENIELFINGENDEELHEYIYIMQDSIEDFDDIPLYDKTLLSEAINTIQRAEFLNMILKEIHISIYLEKTLKLLNDIMDYNSDNLPYDMSIEINALLMSSEYTLSVILSQFNHIITKSYTKYLKIVDII